jgi:hypothetical protein
MRARGEGTALLNKLFLGVRAELFSWCSTLLMHTSPRMQESSPNVELTSFFFFWYLDSVPTSVVLPHKVGAVRSSFSF